jgi:uncharacterized protein (TIGR03000 family)
VYSVVLMMAMTSSPDMAAFGRRNGCDGGCRGGGGGCVGSCYGGGGCYGGGNGCHGGGKARRSRGCHGGGGGCHGCYGGGGCYGGYGGGCHGGVAVGCYGGYGGGCWGGAAAMPGAVAPQPAPAPMPKPPAPAGTTTPPPSDVRLPGAATIVVSLPEGAKLMVDGAATRSTAAVRTFSTPNLNAGQNYFYTLTAEIVRDGQKLTATEQVTVRANETSNVSFSDSKFSQTVALK